MEVHQSIEVAAPPERIWPLMVEPDNVLKWIRLQQVQDEGLSGHRGPRAAAAGKASACSCRLTSRHRLVRQALSLHMVSGTGVKGYDQRWTVEPLPAGSRFTFEEHVELPFGVLGRLMGKVGQRSSEGHVREMLAKLKRPGRGVAPLPPAMARRQAGRRGRRSSARRG